MIRYISNIEVKKINKINVIVIFLRVSNCSSDDYYKRKKKEKN